MIYEGSLLKIESFQYVFILLLKVIYVSYKSRLQLLNLPFFTLN